MSITKAQIKIIHVLKTALKMSEEEYRSRMMGHCPDFASSSLDLSFSQARDLISEWTSEAIQRGAWKEREAQRHRGTEAQRKYDDLGNRPGMASPAQLRKIEIMWTQKSFVHDPAKRAQALRHYCFRIVKKEDLRFLESKDASKLIRSIESLKRREA